MSFNQILIAYTETKELTESNCLFDSWGLFVSSNSALLATVDVF